MISLQRFADYVYLFFPKESWRQLTDKQRREITQECTNLKLGLILVDGKRCEEVVSESRNVDLLEDERRAEARDLVVHYFPSFASEPNAQFFEQISRLAMNIAGESYKLLNECKDVFRKKQVEVQFLLTSIIARMKDISKLRSRRKAGKHHVIST